MMGWLLFSLILSAFLLWRYKSAGPGTAIGESILWGLLVPTWIVLPVEGLPVDVLSTVASVGLIAYCFHGRSSFRTTLCVTDGALVALFVVHIVSDYINDGWGIGMPCRAYGEWIVPYLAGRVSVRDDRDIRALRSTACLIAVIFSIWAVTESIAGFNPVNSLVGFRPADDAPYFQERWGFKRAEGPTIHPIWFGMIQAILLPWTLSAANSSLHGRSPRWQIFAPLFSAVGVFFSFSRGPWGLVILSLYGTVAFRFPRARIPMFATGAIAIVIAIALSDSVVQGLHTLTSKKASDQATLKLDDEKVVYDETTHRLVLFKVYSEAMHRAGWIGFGTDRTTGFPVRVPMGELDPTTMRWVRTIDNGYILMQLRFGAMGVVCFVLVLSSAAVLALVRGCRAAQASGLFHASLGSTILSILLVLMVEYLPRDYQFLLLWSLGTIAGFGAYGDRAVVLGDSDIRAAGGRKSIPTVRSEQS